MLHQLCSACRGFESWSVVCVPEHCLKCGAALVALWGEGREPEHVWTVGTDENTGVSYEYCVRCGRQKLAPPG